MDTRIVVVCGNVNLALCFKAVGPDGGASQLVTCQSALDLDGIDLSNQNVGCKQVLIHVENKQHA